MALHVTTVVVMELGFIKHKRNVHSSLYMWVGGELETMLLDRFHLLCVTVAVAKVTYKDRVKCGS